MRLEDDPDQAEKKNWDSYHTKWSVLLFKAENSVHIHTHYTEQRESLERKNRSDSQGISHVICKPKIRYRVTIFSHQTITSARLIQSTTSHLI
jgi:hypothetical protein